MAHVLFLTGKLAEPALRRMAETLADTYGFRASVAVLPITVVALAPTAWIAARLSAPEDVDRVVVPGLCPGELTPIQAAIPHAVVERGPKDLRDLPEHFGGASGRPADYGAYDIAILAEINHAPRLATDLLVARARKAVADGADVVDLGCDPGSVWTGVGDAVKRLRDEGIRVSIDTFEGSEAGAAARAGAELVLSVNASNREAAPDWGCEVVVVPDDPRTLAGLDETIDFLSRRNVPFRLDPVLEPIGFGFADSLARYYAVRQRYPDAEMMMGVGNLTELTDVDSAGVNVTLLGYCQELGVRSVLTTEVIPWARSCVRELDLARRLVAYACRHRVLPKRLEPGLVTLRDPKSREHGAEALAELAARVADRNVRLFAERGAIHVVSSEMQLSGDDPFALFAEMSQRTTLDPSHAFYLGYEIAKAMTALTLGKNYVQDQALRWGHLTREEPTRHGPRPPEPRP